MRTRNSYEPPLKTEAVVQRVDPISRELIVLIDGVLTTIYVRPGCDVVLRGERIKLRMVQPRDRVRVTYNEHAKSMIADAIDVQPGHSTSSRLQ
jgi:hypothetical protein